MNRSTLVALVFTLSAPLYAQPAADPSGHWAGAIQPPGREIRFEVDLARNANGELVGTFSNPGEHINGYPLSAVATDGATVRFELKVGSGGGPFVATLSPDAKSMAGEFTATTAEGTYKIPFSVTRTGDPAIESPPKSPAVSRELVGSWTGDIDIDGKAQRLGLRVANQPDGTARGVLITPQGVEIPVAIAQKASSVTVDVKVTGGSYAATLDKEGTELAGTWTQQSFTVPLTLRRCSTCDRQ
jgi:hypothetical protein